MRIALDSVSKHYVAGAHRQNVLRDITAEFASGRFVVLVGRSGSGKSTLLNLIAGFDAPDEGRIVISDQLISGGDDATRTLFRRQHLGFVFQFFNLIPTLNVGENVQLPLELLGTASEPARERVAAALEEVGMAGFQDRFMKSCQGASSSA